MNKILVAVAAMFVLAGTAVAADAPATIVLESKNGKVTFQHKAHQEKLKGDCKVCHGDAAPGKIAGWGKDKAHETCRGCHKKSGKGPDTKCTECHKKA